MGIFSDTKLKDSIQQSALTLISIKNDLEVIREAQIAMNKRFSYLEEKLKVALKGK